MGNRGFRACQRSHGEDLGSMRGLNAVECDENYSYTGDLHAGESFCCLNSPAIAATV